MLVGIFLFFGLVTTLFFQPRFLELIIWLVIGYLGIIVSILLKLVKGGLD